MSLLKRLLYPDSKWQFCAKLGIKLNQNIRECAKVYEAYVEAPPLVCLRAKLIHASNDKYQMILILLEGSNLVL